MSNLLITCCKCGQKCPEKESHNAWPLVEKGRCCSDCNLKYVIPARMKKLNETNGR